MKYGFRAQASSVKPIRYILFSKLLERQVMHLELQSKQGLNSRFWDHEHFLSPMSSPQGPHIHMTSMVAGYGHLKSPDRLPAGALVWSQSEEEVHRSECSLWEEMLLTNWSLFKTSYIKTQIQKFRWPAVRYQHCELNPLNSDNSSCSHGNTSIIIKSQVVASNAVYLLGAWLHTQ